MMPPADRIRELNEQDPGRVVHIRQEAGPNDFLAVGPALRILQLNVECLSVAKRSIIRNIAERHNVEVICLQETHVDADCAGGFSISGFDLISYTLHAKHGRALYTRNDLIDISPQLSTSHCDVVKMGGYNIANVYEARGTHGCSRVLPQTTFRRRRPLTWFADGQRTDIRACRRTQLRHRVTSLSTSSSPRTPSVAQGTPH